MKVWPFQLGVAVVLVAVVGGIGWLIGEDCHFRESQKAHEARPLVFDPPAQPDAVGPVRVRFTCPERRDRGAVTVRVFYLGYPNEAGRPYANETSEILLDAVYATGRSGGVIEVPAKATDRRVRGLIDGPFGADIFVAGQDGPYGSYYVTPGDDMTGVIEVRCEEGRRPN